MQRAGAWPYAGALAWMQSHTHVGQGERAAAAALIGLLVASQLVEGARLAEQRPDVLAVQAQRLLAVLQRLLIQALPERSRCSVNPLPSLPCRDRGCWRTRLRERLQSHRKQLWCSHAGQGHPCVQLQGRPIGIVRTLEGGAFMLQ